MTATPGFGPLNGVRVLDVGTMIAAPYGAALLADFGADVVKVEMPGSGDSSRNLAPHFNGESLRWPSFSRNKRCITLDLKSDTGRDVFLKLVEKSDMIMENFRPGTLDRWGLDYETLKKANPGIVVVHVSGYGQSGPLRDLAGFGTPATAFSGVTYLMGDPSLPPMSPPFSLADYVAGMMAALAGVMALYHRDVNHDDEGQEVDVSLYEPLFRMLEALIAEYDKLGIVRDRTPGLSGGASPSGTFKTKDGKWMVLVTSTERTWQRLPAAIGRPELLDDPRFATNADRLEHDDILLDILAEWFACHTRDEVQEKLDAAGCPVSLVYSIQDIIEDPHYQARESFIEVQHPTLGHLKMPGIVPKFSRTPGEVKFAGPELGAHNDEILTGLLGLSPEDVEKMQKDGVI